MTVNAYYQNVRGLNGKAHLILPVMSLPVYDLVLFTEIWLADGFNDGEIFLMDQYHVYRKYHSCNTSSKCTGGGALIGVRKSLPSIHLPLFERTDLEMVWVKLEFEVPVYVCCVYLPGRAISNAYLSFAGAQLRQLSSLALHGTDISVAAAEKIPS